MATWTVDGQLTNATTLSIGATDRLWLNGASFGTNVTVGSYQDTTHISNSSDVHQCSTNHVNNTKYLTSSTVSLNGAGSAALNTLTTANCPLKFNFSDAASVSTSAAKFYAYDGTTDANPWAGVTFQAFEQGNASWSPANGSAAALNLADQGASTSHNFFVGLSASPTSTGAKSGKVKITLTYV